MEVDGSLTESNILKEVEQIPTLYKQIESILISDEVKNYVHNDYVAKYPGSIPVLARFTEHGDEALSSDPDKYQIYENYSGGKPEPTSFLSKAENRHKLVCDLKEN